LSDSIHSALVSGVPPAAIKPRTIKVIRPPSFSPIRLLGAARELFGYRDLIFTLCIHRLKVRYSQSALGWLWAVLQPLALMLIYTVIFSLVTKIPSGGVPYALFVYSALLPWTYFSTILNTAAGSLVKHTNLITKVYFPREILPITYIVVGLFDFCVASVFLGGMMLYYKAHPNGTIWWAIPCMLILTGFGGAVALVFSALEVRFRDVGLAMPLVVQVWMFATPVVYPLSAVPARFHNLYVLNPLTGAIENFRRALLGNEPIDFVSLKASALITAIVLPLAYLFFKHREASMADII
jgi:lipopolysaccharide transport system permease protein